MVIAPRVVPDVQAIMKLCNELDRNDGHGVAAPRVPRSSGLDRSRNPKGNCSEGEIVLASVQEHPNDIAGNCSSFIFARKRVQYYAAISQNLLASVDPGTRPPKNKHAHWASQYSGPYCL